MPALIVLGAQWGDEGKGKIVDLLSEEADLVVRFQGGANAGHTVVLDGEELVLHLLPSGVLRERCINVIGNGCVVDVELLADEIDRIAEGGFDVTPRSLLVSERAHIVTPAHKFMDRLLGGAIGTTGRGIGPTYADKAKRTGIRVSSLRDGSFAKKYLELAGHYKSIVEKVLCDEFFDIAESLKLMEDAIGKVKPFIADASDVIARAVADDKKLLYEGAQGAMLDIDHGSYPFVTSSNTTIGSAYSGTGVFVEFDYRVAVLKAYSTRVGNGPFPTEQANATGYKLRERGGEYGATTGRPRRCGWLDLELVREAFRMNGFNAIALTKVDCLSAVDMIKVAVGRDEKGDPVYREFDSWDNGVGSAGTFEELPSNCRAYIEFIEEELVSPVALISTGQGREQTIARRRLWG
jgi:adenylosuccinate synthase